MKTRAPILRRFRDVNTFSRGTYSIHGIELNLPFATIRIGRFLYPKDMKLPGFYYIGKRHTHHWTLRVWNFGVAVRPNR